MTSMQEALFHRLQDRYHRRFGSPPPLAATTLDEAIAYMRRALRSTGGRRDERARGGVRT